jgi:general secretion pathway protein D
LGAAFRQERATRSKTELYIVITPRIVRHRRFADSAARDAENGAPRQDQPALEAEQPR